MEDKLIKLLEKKIKKLDFRIREIIDSRRNPFKDKKDELIKIRNNPLDIDIGVIKEINGELNVIDSFKMKHLEIYAQLSKFKNFPLTEEQKTEISSTMDIIINRIDEITSLISNEDDEETINLRQELEKLIKLKQKLCDFKNNIDYLNSKDIDGISNLMIEYNFDKESITEALIYAILKSADNMKNVHTNKQVDGEEIVEVNITSLDRQVVINLFSEFGYNFEQFDNKSKELIINYGVIENIRGILFTFTNNNVGKINLEKHGKQLAVVLVNSNADNILTIINNIKEDIANTKDASKVRGFNETFIEYLKRPSLFAKGRRVYVKKGKPGLHGPGGEPGPGENNSQDFEGAYDKYIENRRFLIELGVDMQSAVEECAHIFTVRPEVIKNNVKLFDFYQIPRETYTKVLSALGASKALSSIDQFIEVGCYEFIKNNFSYVIRTPKDAMFYRIIKAKKLGHNIFRQYSNANINKIELISDITRKGYGIDRNTDKEKEVEQYIPQFDSIYDEKIDVDKCAGPLVYSLNDEYIRKLDILKSADGLSYRFNDIIISRLKVLRIYEEMIKNGLNGSIDSIKYAICKNSILTKEQYSVIEECLAEIYKKTEGVGPR